MTYSDMKQEDVKVMREKSLVIEKLFKATFSTPNGKKCLAEMKRAFVDRPIARAGMTELEIGIRQGECNVIRKILGEVNGNR